jgi:hypothetical protein
VEHPADQPPDPGKRPALIIPDHTHTESLRAKLKRMVARAVLTEPEPGLFTLPRPGHDA